MEFGNALNGIDSLDVEKILQRQAQRLAPDIREELSSNYASAGVGNRTGRLQNTVSRAEVVVGKTRIKVSFEAGVPATDRGDVYKYGNAINYGAVRNAGGAGARLKKSIKRNPSVFNSGNIKVMPAKKFFYLADEQVASLSEKLVGMMQNSINSEVK